ncbi:DUF58 domain-containing protein [Ferviditalea candida]|uniref:DUF58 domain-containing protein n=1 Tax=Ferviditalea candida TaxID=3108399 RepID=A0ABU5ZN30_9BACL|nr:DUF58 domain-containing protein [Paenibacillaceae bacterium T2]
MSLLFVWAGALFSALLSGGFSPWFLFYSTSVIVLYAIGVQLFFLQRIEARRQLAGSGFMAGEDVKVSLTVTFRYRFPFAWLIVQDQILQDGKPVPVNHRRMFMPGLGTAVIYQYAIPSIPRGKYRFSSVEVYAGDLFGFVQKRVRIPMPQELTVYPRPLDLTRSLTDPAGRYEGAASTMVRLPEGSVQISGIRDYVYGDRISRIDWKVSSRSLGLKTKETAPGISERLLVVLNAERKCYEGNRGRAMFETAVRAAAGIVRSGIDESMKVGLVLSDKGCRSVPASRLFDASVHFDRLAAVKADGEFSTLQVLMEEESKYPSGSGVSGVYITPVLDEGLGKLLEQRRTMRGRWHIVYVFGSPTVSLRDRQYSQALRASGFGFSCIAADSSESFQSPEGGEKIAGVS